MKYILGLWLLSGLGAQAQSLTISGNVSSAGRLLPGVLIDIYEYNTPITTIESDEMGHFSFNIVKGREHLIVCYKSGYILQSFSISDRKQNPQTSYSFGISLEPDLSPPLGLNFAEPMKRISPETNYKSFVESRFALSNIRPEARADSVRVLINRASANQYILLANMGMANNPALKYSRQMEDNMSQEISRYARQMEASAQRAEELRIAEDQQVADTRVTTEEEQLAHLTEAQRLLSDRLAARAAYYLLMQQQQLAAYRLAEMRAILVKQQLDTATAADVLERLTKKYWNEKSAAINHKYLANNANRKFQLHNHYQMLNYQEYIEMLRYKNRKSDTIAAAAAKPVAKPLPPKLSLPDTTDNLSTLNAERRTELIQDALKEEDRFKDYSERTENKKVDGQNLSVRSIHIAMDNYEMTTDRKGNIKYLKNGKPVTKVTFEFETQRHQMDVLKTIKEAEGFSK